ncbi:MAG: ferrochelatase [Gemmatimonadota bacterium]|nr:ferrochelatase [Gemmatimonadota bacterium]
MADLTAVLLMAYGTPETPDQVEPYFTHIRGGRAPSPESVSRLRERYRRVGGRTPLLDITRQVATALQDDLDRSGCRQKVYVGMKHWHPFIGEVMREMSESGVTQLTAIALAPHYSRISIGGYRRAIDEAQRELPAPLSVALVERWHAEPAFLDMMATLVREGLARFPASERRSVLPVFSAHSLPERIRSWNDPYEQELLESSAAVADRVGVTDWRFAWQSAGETGEPWIGPDIVEYLETLHAEGVRSVLQVPIGFVSDHLEIYWDIDVEAKEKAAELGMKLERTELPNARPDFVRVLADVVRAAASAQPSS